MKKKKNKTRETEEENESRQEERSDPKAEARELREILLGRTELESDGRLSAVLPGQVHLFQGVADGAWGVRVLGITSRSQPLKTSLSRKDAAVRSGSYMVS